MGEGERKDMRAGGGEGGRKEEGEGEQTRITRIRNKRGDITTDLIKKQKRIINKYGE